jgi:hypothetical protein
MLRSIGHHITNSPASDFASTGGYSLALPLLIKLIQLAFPQIGAAIAAGIPIVNDAL